LGGYLDVALFCVTRFVAKTLLELVNNWLEFRTLLRIEIINYKLIFFFRLIVVWTSFELFVIILATLPTCSTLFIDASAKLCAKVCCGKYSTVPTCSRDKLLQNDVCLE